MLSAITKNGHNKVSENVVATLLDSCAQPSGYSSSVVIDEDLAVLTGFEDVIPEVSRLKRSYTYLFMFFCKHTCFHHVFVNSGFAPSCASNRASSRFSTRSSTRASTRASSCTSIPSSSCASSRASAYLFDFRFISICIFFLFYVVMVPKMLLPVCVACT